MGKNLWRLHALFVTLFLDADSLAISESFEASADSSVISGESAESSATRSTPTSTQPPPAQRPPEDFNDIPRP